MELYTQFTAYIKQKQLFTAKDKLLLAVSGGIDSVVLCELCRLAQFNFSIAHCNFQLRGDESLRDENFVKELSKKLGVECFVAGFDTKAIAAKEKKGIEETARELRYNWFQEIAKEKRFQFIVTAHHADDNAETMAMHFFRGTGLRGLRGIQCRNGNIVRPLLFARRNELEEFARAHALKFVNDQTNNDIRFTRNFFRHRVLPLVAEVYPAATNNLIQNAARLSEAGLLYEQAIAPHKKGLMEIRGKEIHIPVLKLKKAAPLRTIIYEIISEFGFTAKQTEDVLDLLNSDTGKYVRSSTHRIIKNRNWLIISPEQILEASVFLMEEMNQTVAFNSGKLMMERVKNIPNQFPSSPFTVYVDAKEIQFPLLLRRWKEGDYFYPLGMKKKKKLSRFLIDLKLSKPEKENTWVLISNQRIVWVLGRRIDDRFKITASTKSVLQIQYLPAE